MKAENLKLLKDNGFNVPPFTVVKWDERDADIDTAPFRGKYAIRSSCSLEDSQSDSFAGQFNTYLNVDVFDIEKKVKECFESVHNKNVVDYLKERKIPEEELMMDVIIQQMVESDYSGVLFTSNPQGIINESVIVAGKGLGDGIVEDRTKACTYYYNLTDRIYYYEGSEEYLGSDLVEELIDTSGKIKDVFGEYLDIEFAIKDNVIYILQVRPITTLNTDNPVILDNSNIVESYPRISLPLTISFVKFVYSNVFKKEAFRLTKNEKLVAANDDNFNNMVGSANARLYYKISNWYTLIKFLPFDRFIIPIWQDMLGVKNKTYDNTKIKIPFFTKTKTYFYTFHELKNVSKNMDMLNGQFVQINEYFYSHFNENMSTADVKELYEKIKKEILDIWDITLINDLYSFIFTGLLKKRLKRKKLSDEAVNDYICGISNIESLKPIKALVELAYKKGKVSNEEFNTMFDNYISLYGDRNLEELKLESETFRTNRKLLEEKIEQYRSDMNKLETIYKNLNEAKNTDSKIKDDFITRFILKRAMTGIKNREISRLNRSRIYGMVRSMFLQAARNFVKEGRLDDVRDVFYLEVEEIFDDNNTNFKTIINERKKDYKSYAKLPDYSRLVFASEEFDKSIRIINKKEKTVDKDLLEGTPTSNGIAEGHALVITDVNKKIDTKDKILITKMTDPGWVFLLATAGGIIAEKGSFLSHTAIISRELKIPSIVGVENATDIIKTGDYVRMDAYKGKIEIIRKRDDK